jgi:hypothetical protein
MRNSTHHFRARLLPVYRADDAAAWASHHGFPLDREMPLTQLAGLARRWYGRHAQPDWRNATVAEPQRSSPPRLTGDFWRLVPRVGTC